jgi:hypothetical protein
LLFHLAVLLISALRPYFRIFPKKGMFPLSDGTVSVLGKTRRVEGNTTWTVPAAKRASGLVSERFCVNIYYSTTTCLTHT